MNTIIELKNVYFQNKNKIIFQNLNLKIKENQKYAILGINGAGKTSLLKILNGIYFPQKGTYLYRGVEFNQKTIKNKDFYFKFRRECILLFQNADLMFIHPKIQDDLALGLRMQNKSKKEIEKKILKWAEIFDFRNLLNENPLNLSGGERKKIALAMCFLMNPEILLLDEPFNSLDPIFTGILIDLMIKFKRTILFSSHQIQLSMEVTEDIIVLYPLKDIIFIGKFSDFIKNKDKIKESGIFHSHIHHHRKKSHSHIHLHDF